MWNQVLCQSHTEWFYFFFFLLQGVVTVVSEIFKSTITHRAEIRFHITSLLSQQWDGLRALQSGPCEKSSPSFLSILEEYQTERGTFRKKKFERKDSNPTMLPTVWTSVINQPHTECQLSIIRLFVVKYWPWDLQSLHSLPQLSLFFVVQRIHSCLWFHLA